MKSLEQRSASDKTPSREQYLDRHHELQILLDISSALLSSPHLSEVLHQALRAILRTLEFKMGAIYLVKERANGMWLLELAAHHGFSSTLVDSIQCFEVSPAVMDDFYRDHPVKWLPVSKVVFPDLRVRMGGEQIAEIMCVALRTRKRVVGLLYVTMDGGLQPRPDSNEFLNSIGRQIGVAIENAQLFDSVERAKSELEISFDAIQHSIFIVDTRWRIYRINKTSEEVYGRFGSLIGENYARIIYGKEPPREDCPILSCLKNGQPVRSEGSHPRWGGYYHYYAFPVLNSEGVLERVVYYEKDATEARKLEQRLQQSERLKALGTLAAGIAHEIRNPLATINFNTQMLHRELSLDSAQHQMFEDMRQEIKKIDRIVQQVLHFARPSQPQFQPNQLNEIVTYCHELAKVSLRKANLEVTLHLQDDLPLHVVDFNQISQVVMNLMINAIEAMQEEGGKLMLRTFLQHDPSALVLEVSDTGPGILAEDKERIFDPFFTRKPEGTGLGLSITRQILEKHGAYIELVSGSSAGTTFRVVFPLPSSNL
jgi:two-component system NtrC family sensor kinase